MLGNRTHLITLILILTAFAILRASGGHLEVRAATPSVRQKSTGKERTTSPTRPVSQDEAKLFDDIERKLGLKEE